MISLYEQVIGGIASPKIKWCKDWIRENKIRKGHQHLMYGIKSSKYTLNSRKSFIKIRAVIDSSDNEIKVRRWKEVMVELREKGENVIIAKPKSYIIT